MSLFGSAVIRDEQGRVVGQIEGDTFLKTVRASKHMLRKPLGWAFDARIFDRTITPFVRRLVIRDVETGKQYETSLKNFLEHKKEFDRGHGRQYYLTLDSWAVIG